MANELRIRQNFVGGLIEDNPLTSGATTLTSAGLAALVVVGSTQHLPIVLDPDGLYGEPEIVYVTSHTASATTATILRGQEGAVARQHQQDMIWRHGPTLKDFNGDSSWTAVTFTNSWVDFGGAYNTCAFKKDAHGFVHLRGLMKNGTVGSAAFTLPVGYRPEGRIFQTTLSNNSYAALDILTTGEVTPVSPATNAHVSIENFTFEAFQ